MSPEKWTPETWAALAALAVLIELRAYTGVSFWRLWRRLDGHGKRLAELESERIQGRRT